MQNLRFVFVDTLLLLNGEMYRQDFTPDKMIYPLSTAQTTRMMQEYLPLFKDQTQYDGTKRRYIPSDAFSARLLPGDSLKEKTKNAKALVAIFKRIKGDLKALKCAYAEALVAVKGGFNVIELEETFNLSKPQVTRDLMAYRKAHPKQMKYSNSARQYVPLEGFDAPVLRQIYGSKDIAKSASKVIDDVSFLRMLDERVEDYIASGA
ncbi:MAG: hypothetical protein CBC55_00825 [Gammaproteobacteria bacterium TMED95]|uniref:DNA-binding transcriptional repressor CapW winged helix-turn-helix domain-containing protein n=1 Tax=Alteromonas mediterranea TaxID=314275 RepID=A0AAC9JHJ2_9ALTE|nr:hypothetical protein [Alteromonas mediterranea]APD92167.1 hypothetical protein BM524_19805 [Alteromonas mediterranea]APE00022.1 hypothetical protein BM525_20000 [Alteromonas mediterranea]OUV23564.1 MAG: hypothetical protein CBC55_00825 [Gammaproteobacteria bacterium TMED95]|tara:strand:- start:17351 stop:17971 length:621 start_codon:yes stop_codon:yes gene_type:complete